MKTKSVLSYFGSDSEVAERIAAKLDHCKHVTIPFVGGVAILPWIKARAVVCNDANSLVINFYRVVSGFYGPKKRDRLIELCRSTLSHPDEISTAEHYLQQPEGFDECLKAWAYWSMCWIGRKGKGGTKHLGGQPSVRWSPEGGTNATRIAAAADDLTEWAKHFKRCEFVQGDWRPVLAKVSDNEQRGLYVDAPWVGSGRNYLHSFTEQDHRDLANALSRFEQASIVVRYGNCDLINELYPRPAWFWGYAESTNQAGKQGSEVWISKNCGGLFD